MMPPHPATFWTAQSVLRAALGEVASMRLAAGSGWIAPHELASAGQVICTDSRAIKPGQIFIAIRGERVDGHGFIADALKAGAGLILSEKNAAQLNLAGSDAQRFASIGIIVPSTLSALQDLARAYRHHLHQRGCRFIAVCGSNGKTTTVRMLEALIACTHRVTASQKSFNNHIGVPLTILSAKESDDVVICEAGTNHPGELDVLGTIIEPDTLLYTSIGREHLEGFGTLEGVMREEASMAHHVGRLTGAGAIISTVQNPEFSHMLESILGDRAMLRGGDVVLLQISASSIRDVQHILIPGDGPADHHRVGVSFNDHHGLRWQVPIPGIHNAANAMLAAAACQGLDGPFDADSTPKRRDALAKAKLGDMRLMVQQIGPVSLLNDAYNANPESMLSSLQTFADLRRGIWQSKRGVIILGEMRELGTNSSQMHAEILTAAINLRASNAMRDDQIIAMGQDFAQAAAILQSRSEPLESVRIIPSLDDQAMQQVASEIRPSDCVLLKASRGVRLERIASHLSSRFTTDASSMTHPSASQPSTVERAR